MDEKLQVHSKSQAVAKALRDRLRALSTILARLECRQASRSCPSSPVAPAQARIRKYGNMGPMKTTLEIPDTLFRRAKSRAAERGQTLKQLVSEALQEKLAARTGTARPGEPEWMQGFGKLRRLRKETAAHPGQDRRALRDHRARGSSVILDTNALSAFVDGDAGVREALRREARAAIPVIVLANSATASRSRGTAQPTKRGWKPSFAHFEILDGHGRYRSRLRPRCASLSSGRVVRSRPTTPGSRPSPCSTAFPS